MRGIIVIFSALLALAVAGCGDWKTPDEVNQASGNSGGTSNSGNTVIGTDTSGVIQLYTFNPYELSRDAQNVNLSVQTQLKNTGNTNASVEIDFEGANSSGTVVYSNKITVQISAGQTVTNTTSYGAVLSISQFDSIVSWSVTAIKIV